MARSSKYKRRPLIPFGDIMLPVIGLVGLGLLIFGIKVFFIPESVNPDEQYQQIIADKRTDTGNVVYQKEASKMKNDEVFIAVPMNTEDTVDLAVKTVPEKKAVVKKRKKPVAVIKHLKKSQSVSLKGEKIAWYVQVGAFKQVDASNQMEKDVISKGFKPLIKKSMVNGALFYKVLVPGGATREQALKVGSKLANLGYPYFLFKR